MTEKTCATCGRTIEPRKKWKSNFSEVKYCSERCRRDKPRGNFEEFILDLLQKRGAGKTICPSEILPSHQRQDPKQMELVRQAARRLVASGKIEITQKGQVVDPSTAKGPIRLRLRNTIS